MLGLVLHMPVREAELQQMKISAPPEFAAVAKG
ncbi:hypothetical protein DP23_4108 [Ralstonia pickettii]|nr:hypothetical protein DP23_4108 [Ralstonia pickettii]